MKNILHIAPDLNVKGGITTVLHGYMQSTLTKNFNILVIASHRDGTKAHKLIVAVLGLLKTFYKLSSGHIDLVHLHCGDLPSPLRKYFYFRLVRLFNTKVVLHFHGANFIDQYNRLTHAWKKRLQVFFSQVDKLICLSKTWEEKIKKISPTAKTIVIPNALKIPHRQKFRVSSVHPLRLGFLGHIGKRKGIFDLLKVLADIKSQGVDVYLEVGGNGDIDSFHCAVKHLKIEEQVIYHGWIGPMEKELLFSRIHAYVLPSYAEGMPMSVLEAMAHGLPVVSTNVGGIPDLVCHDKTGFLVSPGDRAALSQAIKRFALEPDLIIKFGENGRERVIDRHQLKSITKLLMNLYQDLIN